MNPLDKQPNSPFQDFMKYDFSPIFFYILGLYIVNIY